MLDRTRLINRLIKDFNFKSYLEIGINSGVNFNLVECDFKVGVDPNCDATYRMTSDAYFLQYKYTYDLVFIDGLHLAEQVYKDTINSIKVLNPGGIILIHDCLPEKEERQLRVRKTGNWQGDIWKAVVELAKHNYSMELLKIETGIVLVKNEHKEYNIPGGELTFKWYKENFIKMFK